MGHRENFPIGQESIFKNQFRIRLILLGWLKPKNCTSITSGKNSGTSYGKALTKEQSPSTAACFSTMRAISMSKRLVRVRRFRESFRLT